MEGETPSPWHLCLFRSSLMTPAPWQHLVIKHLRHSSKVAKPDQLFTTPNRNLRLFVLGESDSLVEDLLLHGEHQEELNRYENDCE